MKRRPFCVRVRNAGPGVIDPGGPGGAVAFGPSGRLEKRKHVQPVDVAQGHQFVAPEVLDRGGLQAETGRQVRRLHDEETRPAPAPAAASATARPVRRDRADIFRRRRRVEGVLGPGRVVRHGRVVRRRRQLPGRVVRVNAQLCAVGRVDPEAAARCLVDLAGRDLDNAAGVSGDVPDRSTGRSAYSA